MKLNFKKILDIIGFEYRNHIIYSHYYLYHLNKKYFIFIEENKIQIQIFNDGRNLIFETDIEYSIKTKEEQTIEFLKYEFKEILRKYKIEKLLL